MTFIREPRDVRPARARRPRARRHGLALSASLAMTLTMTLTVALTLVWGAPAFAGGLLDALFGLIARQAPAAYNRPFGHTDAPDRLDPSNTPRGFDAPGRGYAYCVRLCDGRYFPLAGGAPERRVETCRALCPASETQVFSGSDSGPGVARDGTRYDALPNAFRYRDEMPPGCTCNGKTPYGLASIDPESDPTLRRGDIIASSEGMKVYTGASRGGRRTAAFAPAESYSPMPPDLRRKLTTMQIEPTQ